MAMSQLIAVVEDDAGAREAIGALLRAACLDVAGFEDAAGFLGSEARARAVCLVADMRLPGMSGLDLYLCLVTAGSPIPTVLITARPDTATRLRAAEAGVTCYLAKPFGSEQLLACIAAAMAGVSPDTPGPALA